MDEVDSISDVIAAAREEERAAAVLCSCCAASACVKNGAPNYNDLLALDINTCILEVLEGPLQQFNQPPDDRYA